MLWLLYLPFDLFVTVLAYPIAPILALYADGNGDVTLKDGNIFRLWLTPDNPIEGDEEHFERWASFVSKHPSFGLYCQRVAWLWRNKAYGWEMTKLNVFIQKDDDVQYKGEPYVSDKPYKSGYCYAWMPKRYWMLYWVAPFLFGKCIRLYIGWKMQSAVKDRLNGNPDDHNAMYVFSFNPFKSRG